MLKIIFQRIFFCFFNGEGKQSISWESFLEYSLGWNGIFKMKINQQRCNEPTIEQLWYEIVKIVHELKETSWYMNSL